MNVLLIDPARDCQGDGYASSLDHRVAMAIFTMKGAVKELFELSSNPDALALIECELADLYGAQLALSIVTVRAKS